MKTEQSAPTIASIKEAVERYVRTAFDSESFPHALTWQGDGSLKIMALAMPVRDAINEVALCGCYAAALMNEAYGATKDDIISISIDHPDGVVIGRAEVDNAADNRIGAFSWTTELEPLTTTPIRFPRLSHSGKFIKLRVMKTATAEARAAKRA